LPQSALSALAVQSSAEGLAADVRDVCNQLGFSCDARDHGAAPCQQSISASPASTALPPQPERASRAAWSCATGRADQRRGFMELLVLLYLYLNKTHGTASLIQIIACPCRVPDAPLLGFEAGDRPPTRRHTTRCEQAPNVSLTP